MMHVRKRGKGRKEKKGGFYLIILFHHFFFFFFFFLKEDELYRFTTPSHRSPEMCDLHLVITYFLSVPFSPHLSAYSSLSLSFREKWLMSDLMFGR